MNARFKLVLTPPLALALAVSMAITPVAYSPLGYSQSYAAAQDQPAYTQQELDQMLAPVALYPDSLLSQILMASTYPLEVVEAARWSRARPDLRGDEAVRAVENQNWDPSVKSLVAFPQILSMMDEKLDWTERMGDAFLAQESEVMDTVQQLRQRAYAAGNLRSNEQIRVVPQGPTIIVEPANPQVVYVPYYDPTIVYGSWWWPAYPPVYWAPWAGYHARPGVAAGFVWGSGIAVSAGFFFGAFDWPHRHARVVNVNNYYYNRTVVVNRGTHVTRVVRNTVNTTPGEWRHDPDHRRGVPYREASVRQQFSRSGASPGTRVQTRERNAPAANPERRNPPPARVRPQATIAAPAPARPAERSTESRDAPGQRANPRADTRRDERAAERPQTRGLESNRPATQTAPANRGSGQPNAAVQRPRTEIRGPEVNRRVASPVQVNPAQATRTPTPAIDHRAGGSGGRTRDAGPQAARERAAPEARAAVAAPRPQPEASAPRPAVRSERAEEPRGENHRENSKK